MDRHDYAFPFRIDPASGQAARTAYADHVAQMVRQVLLTAPGERVDLPEFGCGLRQLLFAPHSEALQATTQLLVRQALQRWLAGQIAVKSVTVSGPEEVEPGELVVEVEYVLVETASDQRLDVRVS
jgi:phage baseplate assembly protein W